MSKNLNLLAQGILTTVLISTLVVACGKQDARKRVPGQKTTPDKGDPNKDTNKDLNLNKDTNKDTSKDLNKGANKDLVKDPKKGNEGGGDKKTDKKPDLSTLTKIAQVDHILIQENDGKSFQKAFQNHANILKRIVGVGLSYAGDRERAEFEATLLMKSEEKPVVKKYKTDGAVKKSEIDNRDVSLGNGIKLRMFAPKEFLLRISDNGESEVLALVFKDQGSNDLELTHVLGSEDNARDVKKLSDLSQIGKGAEASKNQVKNSLATLEEISQNPSWSAIYAEISGEYAMIKDLFGKLEAKVAGSTGSLDSETTAMVQEIRVHIDKMRETITQKSQTPAFETVKENLMNIITTLKSIKLPGESESK